MEEAGWPVWGCLGGNTEAREKKVKEIEVRKLQESEGGEQKPGGGEMEKHSRKNTYREREKESLDSSANRDWNQLLKLRR